MRYQSQIGILLLLSALGCAGCETATESGNVENGSSAVGIHPRSLWLKPGATQQFAAFRSQAEGDSVQIAPEFSASGGTITPAGLFTAGEILGLYRVVALDTEVTGVADTATVTITSAEPPAPGSEPNPTLLPAAAGQDKDASFRYGRDLNAGGSYVDPLTGVIVIKLSDASTPASNVRVTVHGAQVASVSLPWGANGEMRTVGLNARDQFTRPWLVDVNTQTFALSNWRNLDTKWGGSDAVSAIAFSPRDPRIVYVASTGGQIRKYDTQTGAFVTDAFFPKTIPGLSRGSILFVSRDENVFVVTKYNRQWFKYWTVSTNSVCQGGTGQGGLSPDGRWGWGTEEDNQSNFAYKVATNDCSTSQPFTFRVSHPAGVDKHLVGGDPTRSGGPQMHYWDLENDEKVELLGPGELIGGSRHMAGNWVIGQPDPPWAMVSTFTRHGIFKHAIGYFRLDPANPDPRILVHTDSEVQDASDFLAQPHAAWSPDGRVVVWESRSGGGSRIDSFMALVPGR